LQNFKKGSPFWEAFSVRADFVKTAKQKYSTDELEKHIESRNELCSLVKALSGVVTRLVKMDSAKNHV
jgi:hypothetical protein